jgi:hypothetical protein
VICHPRKHVVIDCKHSLGIDQQLIAGLGQDKLTSTPLV